MKEIDINSGQFEANGKVYLIQPNKLSIERFAMYEKLGLELGFGVGYKEIFEAFASVYQALTTGNEVMASHHKAVTICYNQMQSIKSQGDTRIPAQVLFCTLFCNVEGENLAEWDEDLANRKINDWKVEGLNVVSFFHLAVTFLNGLTETLQTTVLAKVIMEYPSLMGLSDSALNPKVTAKKGQRTSPKKQ